MASSCPARACTTRWRGMTCSSSPPACCIRNTRRRRSRSWSRRFGPVSCASRAHTPSFFFVIFAALVFYGLTAVGLFALRAKRPAADRPVRAPGYPWLPALYVIATAVIAVDLLVQDATRTYSFLGLGLVLIGVPVYFVWRTMVGGGEALR